MVWTSFAEKKEEAEEEEEAEEKIRLKQYVSLRSKGRHNKLEVLKIKLPVELLHIFIKASLCV